MTRAASTGAYIPDLKVPRRVRRWVAGRIAQSLPPAPRSIAGGKPASDPSEK